MVSSAQSCLLNTPEIHQGGGHTAEHLTTLRRMLWQSPVADAARDSGIGRRQETTQDPSPRQNVGEKVKVLAKKIAKWSSSTPLAFGFQLPTEWSSMCRLPPTDLKHIRSKTAACSGVGGHQACSVTVVVIGMGKQHNPAMCCWMLARPHVLFQH